MRKGGRGMEGEEGRREGGSERGMGAEGGRVGGTERGKEGRREEGKEDGNPSEYIIFVSTNPHWTMPRQAVISTQQHKLSL